MSPVIALSLSLAVVCLGHFLASALERRTGLKAFLDGLVLVMVAGLCLMFLLPGAHHALGLAAFPLALLGFLLPALAERQLHRHEESRTVLVLALIGLALHCILEGGALSAVGHEGDGHGGHGHLGEEHGAGLELTLAVVAHRLPVGLLLGSTVAHSIGAARALGALALVLVATVAGFFLGPHLATLSAGHSAGVLDALLAGGLLHVVAGHGHREESRASAAWAGAGALVAVALFAGLPLESGSALQQGWQAAVRLFHESSLAILAGFTCAGLLSLVPTETLARLMKGKTAFTSALRGVVFGLPIPICSCGVVPIYRGLMKKGVPPAAAIAFLIATPELGVDAVILSIPLLGIELTIVRFLTAVAVALCAGIGVSLLLRGGEQTAALEGEQAPETDDCCDEEEPAEPKLTVFKRGFFDALDELGPWMLAGLLVAGMIYPLLKVDWVQAVPAWAQVPLFSALAAPFYLCASSATPVAAVFILKGVAVGAVIAFLITGPATNVTTYGAMRLFHSRRVTILAIGIILATSVFLGLVVNAMTLTQVDPLAHGEHAVGPLEMGAGVLFALLLAGSLLRQGPRGFLRRLGLGHEHEQEHEHEHGHGHGHGPADEAHDPCLREKDCCD